jgi:hypothetical protein
MNQFGQRFIYMQLSFQQEQQPTPLLGFDGIKVHSYQWDTLQACYHCVLSEQHWQLVPISIERIFSGDPLSL